MRHAVFGKKLSRTKNERRRLLQGLARDVILRSSIKTTVTKAKAVQPLVEQLVTKAKKADSASRAQLAKILDHDTIEKQLLDDAKTRFAYRRSGFTRIVRLGKRTGDATEEALLQFVDERVVAEVVNPVKKEQKTPIKAAKAKEKPDSKVLAEKRGRAKKVA